MIDVINLTNTLKVLARDLKKLQSSINTNPTTPDHFVHNAEADARINEIKAEQTAVGELLLEHDKARQIKAIQRLDAQTITGANAAAELLEKLPAFANKVSTAFKILGGDFSEILELSKLVRRTNMVLIGANRHQCCPASVRIEPTNLHRLLKEQFSSSFGANTANVYLSHDSTVEFISIVDSFDKIQLECTEGVAHEQAK